MPLTILTRPHPIVWQITLNAPPDNRLTPELLSSLADNLDHIEAQWRTQSGKRDTLGPGSSSEKWGEYKGAGAVVLTGGEGRFFSNGLDFENSLKIERFFERIFDPVMYRLLTFPLLTIAALNGHTFAGGMCIALSCDYRLMTSGKGLLCMNEIQFGSPIPNSFAALLRIRIPNSADLRDTMLARRWAQAELLEQKWIDEVVKPEELISRAVEVGKKEGVKVGSGTWGQIKDSLYHELIDASKSWRPLLFPPAEAKAFWKRYKGDGEEKAKL